MKISAYIKHLQDLQALAGDIEVYCTDFRTTMGGAVMPASPPKVVELRIPGPREQYTKVYYHGLSYGGEPSGVKVVRI